MKPLVYTTRCLHATGIITALVFYSTVSLSADSVFTPFIGKSYGENDTEKVTTPVSYTHLTLPTNREV